MARRAAHLDFETRSAVDLKKVGTWNYALHDTTKAWGFAWGFSAGTVEWWRPGDEDPLELLAWIEQGGTIVAHNAVFERLIWNLNLVPRVVPYWPKLTIEQMDCTMVRAMALALPADLERAAAAVNSPFQKDMEGAALMKRMMKPRKARKDEDPHELHWIEEPEKVARLGRYCVSDVRAEFGIDERTEYLDDRTRRVWHLDQRINDRGFRVDTVLARKLLALVDRAVQAANAKVRELTGGAVQKCTEHAKVAAWINSRGIPCTSVAKALVGDLMAAAAMVGDDEVVAVLSLRRATAKASNAKLQAMLNFAGPDQRARHQIQFHGASTGRFAGRGIQPHNLPRFDKDRDLPIIDAVLAIARMLDDPELALAMINACHGDVNDPTGGPALPWVSKSLRRLIVAAPRKKLVGADWKNIEGRINAWIPDEDWKLKAFREFDAGTGPDLYTLAFSNSFGVAIDQVSKTQRQVGKVEELALGYQGSHGAWISMGKNYGMKPSDCVATVYEATSPNMWANFAAMYDKPGTKRMDLTRDEWTAIKVIVVGWREAHPNIVQGWWDRQDAAIEAVLNPGTVVPLFNGKVRYMSKAGFLWTALPSGRLLAYAKPRVVEVVETETVETSYVLAGDDGEEETVTLTEEIELRRKRAVEYWGTDGITKQWRPFRLYGGHQCENDVQATAADLLWHGLEAVEAHRYPVVMHVHDDIVAEVDESFGSAREFERIMTDLPPYLEGLPLAADAWEGQRYGA